MIGYKKTSSNVNHPVMLDQQKASITFQVKIDGLPIPNFGR